MKDGAHTHGNGGGVGGLGVAVAIGAGAVLADRIAPTVARILPVLMTGVAVIVGLWVAGWVARAVMVYRCQQEALSREPVGAVRPAQLSGAVPAGRELLALRQEIQDLHVQLADRAASGELHGPARHEHLHFHGLAAEQVAAVLARQQAQPPSEGEW